MTYSEYEYEIGQKIYHAVYGYGIILSKTDIGQGVYRYEVGFQRYPGQIIDVIGNVQMMPIEKKERETVKPDSQSWPDGVKEFSSIIDMLCGHSKKNKKSKEKDDSMAMNERKDDSAITCGDLNPQENEIVFNKTRKNPFSKKHARPVNKKSEPENVAHHRKIVMGLNELYAKKNADYGDSFHETFLEEGMAMARIRLSDKLNRFKSLTRGNNQQVADESIRDTLLDLANYAIMTVIEMDREKEAAK